jgi:ABC-type sulfate/molybdate transport systems ATPase subunit
VLLLDEPMAALDAHTRAGVRAELQELLRELGLPTILGHARLEDAAALCRPGRGSLRGRVLQLGTPDELVAGPGGCLRRGVHRAGNLLHGLRAARRDGLTEVVPRRRLPSSSRPSRGEGRVGVVVYPGRSRSRPRTAVPNDSALNHVSAPISSVVTVGNRVRVRVGPARRRGHRRAAERLALERGRLVVASSRRPARGSFRCATPDG